MASDRVKPIPLISFDSTELTGAWRALNPGGLPYACFYIAINNASDYFVDISFDGINAHEQLSPYSAFNNAFQRNSRPVNNVALLPKGTVIYGIDSGGVKKGGLIYISGWYIE